MLRINKIIVPLLFASCLVSLAGAGEYYSKFKYSEEEAKLYRMPIKQITPKDGIKTGHVIAYGHYIRPPYKIEVKDTMVFINNVQVYPALKTPGMIEKEKRDAEMEEARKQKMRDYIRDHQAEYDEMRRIDSLAKELYEREKASKGKEAAVNAVAEFYKKSAGVDSVRVFGPHSGGLLVCYSPGAIQYELLRIDGFSRPTHRFLDFEPPGICASVPDIYKTQEERDEAMRKMGFPTTKQGWAELRAKTLERTLRDGWVLEVCPPGISGCQLDRESELFALYEVLKEKGKSPDEKYKTMSKILKSPFIHGGILILLENYVPKEWNYLRRQK